MSTTQTGHPKGLYVLFVTEMWERFSYYGMRAIFLLYLIKALLFDKETGGEIYSSYTSLVYLTPLIGGYVADNYWGNRKSIVVGGLLMAVGQFFMFASGSTLSSLGISHTPDTSRLIMYIGLGFMIFGNGFFKPNISSMVGSLYAEGDKRVDAAFTIFYMGINLGAFFAPLVCGGLGDTGNAEDFKWGFLAAGIGMLVSVAFFVYLKDKYIVKPDGSPIGAVPEKLAKTEVIDTAEELKSTFTTKQIFIWSTVAILLLIIFRILLDKLSLGDLLNVLTTDFSAFTKLYFSDINAWIGAAIFSAAIAVPGLIISDGTLTKIEKERIWVIYIVAFFVIFFWAAFEQAGLTLTYFAEEQTDRSIGSSIVPASFFQSINAVAIVIFAPIFGLLWTYLGKKNQEPASPYKQAIGLFLLAIGYLVIAVGVKNLGPGVKVSMLWLITLYTIHTFGELCLSPIGLSMVNKLAPAKFAALLMGVWFLSTAAANKFSGVLGAYYPKTMITVSAIEEQQKNNTAVLCENFSKSDTIQGVAYISLDDISYDKIKDKTLKASTLDNLFKTSIIKEKTFVGFKINSLYSFFMLFVVMAGIASIILFFLSKKLVTMMHEAKEDSQS
ncbi:MAG: peptide MFS transporter [Bacteroidia bacterium]|nr:peptide MFS transporter [Bacteroidia bacterium]